jgi:EmrB/QacA subfamily drug resistance transporter
MDTETIQRRRWGILGVLMICLLVVVLDNTILNVALRTIQNDLSASQSSMQWAVDSYALVFAGLLITWGVLGDRIGRKKILLFGMITFGATSALCSFAQSPGQLILFRALMGIGAAAVQPQTLSIIQNVFEPAERGKAIGIWAAGAGSAIAIGPLAGGALLKYFWWGSVFLVNVPIVIIGVVLIFFLIPESKNPKPGALDPQGVLLSMVALVLLVYGIITGGNSNHWLTFQALGAIVAGVLLLALFVFLEARSSHPTIDVRLFKNREFSAGGAAIGLTFFALMGATFFLAYFLQAVRGYTPLAAGVALIAVAAAQLIFAPLSSRFSAKIGVRSVVALGMLIAGLSMMSYCLLTETSPQWLIEVAMFGLGAGMGMTMAPATTAIMSAVPREKAGAGSAVNNTVRQVAGALGVAVLGSLLAVVFRSHLGVEAPNDVAARLDQPAAVVQKLPAGQQVRPQVKKDASESIGGALEFAGKAQGALQARGAAGATPPTDAQKQQAVAALGGFVQSSKDSFVSAMHVATFVAGWVNILGAIVAFLFLPGRAGRKHGRHEPDQTDGHGVSVDEAAAAVAH